MLSLKMSTYVLDGRVAVSYSIISLHKHIGYGRQPAFSIHF